MGLGVMEMQMRLMLMKKEMGGPGSLHPLMSIRSSRVFLGLIGSLCIIREIEERGMWEIVRVRGGWEIEMAMQEDDGLNVEDGEVSVMRPRKTGGQVGCMRNKGERDEATPGCKPGGSVFHCIFLDLVKMRIGDEGV